MLDAVVGHSIANFIFICRKVVGWLPYLLPMVVTPLYCMLLAQLLLVYAYANITSQDVKGRCTSSISNSDPEEVMDIQSKHILVSTMYLTTEWNFCSATQLSPLIVAHSVMVSIACIQDHCYMHSICCFRLIMHTRCFMLMTHKCIAGKDMSCYWENVGILPWGWSSSVWSLTF